MDLKPFLDNVYKPVSREVVEYLEMICSNRYCILVELDSGCQFAALALMVRVNRLKEEFLCVGIAEAVREVRLDSICAVTPLDLRPKFERLKVSANNTTLTVDQGWQCGA